jgi:Fic family protein
MDANDIGKLLKQYKKASSNYIDVEKYTYYAVTHHSTCIEGSTLTESQVVELLEHGKTAKNKSFEEHLMVSDHYKAMLYIAELAMKKADVSPLLVQNIAAMVMKNTGAVVNCAAGSFDVSKGEYRKCTVRAGVRTFPDYSKVPTELAKICKEVSKQIGDAKTIEDQLRCAFYAHFALVSLHPFGDGNGRTSRLLMNYIQLRFKLPPSIVYKADKIKYINALEESRKKDSIEPFYKFMFAQYRKFLKSELKTM